MSDSSQGRGLRHVLLAVPTGHLLPAVSLHRLLGQHCCVSTDALHLPTRPCLGSDLGLWGAGVSGVQGQRSSLSRSSIPQTLRSLTSTPSASYLHPTKPSTKSLMTMRPARWWGRPATLRWAVLAWWATWEVSQRPLGTMLGGRACTPTPPTWLPHPHHPVPLLGSWNGHSWPSPRSGLAWTLSPRPPTPVPYPAHRSSLPPMSRACAPKPAASLLSTGENPATTGRCWGCRSSTPLCFSGWLTSC